MDRPVVRTLRYGERDVRVEASAEATLVDVLRSALGVRSASRACRDWSCGACRVFVDGELVSSCAVDLAAVPDGAQIETYELLLADPAAARAVGAFEDERPSRCRMCVGALGVTAVALARGAASGAEAIEAAISGATCMCTGRGSWRRALSK